LSELTVLLELLDLEQLPATSALGTASIALLPTFFSLIGKLVDLAGRDSGDTSYICQLLVADVSAIVGKAPANEIASAGVQVEPIVRLLKGACSRIA
jgi:hypothetical protein